MTDQTVTPSEVAAIAAVPTARWTVAVNTVAGVAAQARVTVVSNSVRIFPTTVAAVGAVATPNMSVSVTVAPSVVAAVAAVVTPRSVLPVAPGVVAAIAGVGNPMSVMPITPDVVAAIADIPTPFVFAPYDRWRPRVQPHSTNVLLCCTQPGNHDTPTGFAEMTLWLFEANGMNRIEVLGTPPSIDDGAATPSLLGWVSYGHPEWSPDSTAVVIYAETTTQYEIVQLHDFEVTAVLHAVTKPNTCMDPSYSPDGGTIVFAEKLSSTYYISTITLGATPIYTQLASSSDALFDPFFSPSGAHIVYTKKTSATGTYGSWDLKVIPAAGGSSSVVLSDANAHMHPDWVDERQIVFQTYRYGTDTEFQVAKINVDGTGLEVLGTGEYPQVVNI